MDVTRWSLAVVGILSICQLVEALTLVNCTFEADMCGMTVTDPPLTPVNWVWGSVQSISQTTRPDVDHTFGNVTGNLMFFNGTISNPLHRSRLHQPPVNVTHPDGACLTLSHVIYGDSGTLSVYIDMCGNSMPLWSYSKNLWEQWITTDIVIPKWARKFGLIFEAKRQGSSDVGISIDDIIITDSPCFGPQTPTTIDTSTSSDIPTTPLLCPTALPSQPTMSDTTVRTTPQSQIGVAKLAACPVDFCKKDHMTCESNVPSNGFFCGCSDPSATAGQTCYREFTAKPRLPYSWAIPTSLLLLFVIVSLVLVVVVCRRRKDIKLFILMQRTMSRGSLYENGNPMHKAPKMSIQNGEFEISHQNTDIDMAHAPTFNDSRLHIDDLDIKLDYNNIPASLSRTRLQSYNSFDGKITENGTNERVEVKTADN